MLAKFEARSFECVGSRQRSSLTLQNQWTQVRGREIDRRTRQSLILNLRGLWYVQSMCTVESRRNVRPWRKFKLTECFHMHYILYGLTGDYYELWSTDRARCLGRQSARRRYWVGHCDEIEILADLTQNAAVDLTPLTSSPAWSLRRLRSTTAWLRSTLVEWRSSSTGSQLLKHQQLNTSTYIAGY